jgi:hypothetical protein
VPGRRSAERDVSTDKEETCQFICQTTLGGSTVGAAGHPFCDAVTNTEDDPRLASFAMTAIDFETYIVFDVQPPASRLFGQGAVLRAQRPSVGTVPAN